MHAELPAARIVLSLQAGDFGGASRAVLDCQQYPFVYPLVLASVQSFTGISEAACRRVGRATWAIAWLGIWLVLAELELAGVVRANVKGVRTHFRSLALFWICSLGMAYSGTLFLEVPFAAVSAFALRAWLARARADDERTRRRRDVAAGAWIALAFFTKFNYGLLFAFGLALDFAFEAFGAIRDGRGAQIARRALHLALVPLVALAWWFVAPLPGGLDVAAHHREAFVAFLGGNQDGAPYPIGFRVIDVLTGVAGRFSIIVVAFSLLAMFVARGRGVRVLVFLLAALAIPIALHPFYLDRFLVPVLVPLFALYAVYNGVQSRFRLLTFSFFVLTLAGVGFLWDDRLLRVAGAWRDDMGDYLIAQVHLKGNFSPSRELPTGGLLRSEADALLDLAAKEVAKDERVAWIGQSSELSPAALHLGLLARGGSSERFLRDSIEPMDVTFEGVDPNWTSAKLAEFASRFDVILATDPPDLAMRADRKFTTKYRALLTTELGWSERELGSIEIHKDTRPPYPVRLFACRRPTK